MHRHVWMKIVYIKRVMNLCIDVIVTCDKFIPINGNKKQVKLLHRYQKKISKSEEFDFGDS